MNVFVQLYHWVEKLFSEEVAAYNIVLWNSTKHYIVYHEEMTFSKL